MNITVNYFVTYSVNNTQLITAGLEDGFKLICSTAEKCYAYLTISDTFLKSILPTFSAKSVIKTGVLVERHCVMVLCCKIERPRDA